MCRIEVWAVAPETQKLDETRQVAVDVRANNLAATAFITIYEAQRLIHELEKAVTEAKREHAAPGVARARGGI